jgi:hypothetical protein
MPAFRPRTSFAFTIGIPSSSAPRATRSSSLRRGSTPSDRASYATSTVTGICALILGAFPGLTPFEIKSALKAHAG